MTVDTDRAILQVTPANKGLPRRRRSTRRPLARNGSGNNLTWPFSLRLQLRPRGGEGICQDIIIRTVLKALNLVVPR
jgi:hypothetical protein